MYHLLKYFFSMNSMLELRMHSVNVKKLNELQTNSIKNILCTVYMVLEHIWISVVILRIKIYTHVVI